METLYVKLKWWKLSIHESQNAQKLALSHMLECMQIAWCSYPCCSLNCIGLNVKECKVYGMELEIDNGPIKLNVSFIGGHGRPHYDIHHNILALDMWPPIKIGSYQQRKWWNTPPHHDRIDIHLAPKSTMDHAIGLQTYFVSLFSSSIWCCCLPISSLEMHIANYFWTSGLFKYT